MRQNAIPLAEQPDALAVTARKARMEELAEMSETRKNEFAEIDNRPAEVLNDLDLAAQEREEAVLAKANAMLEDDEDEVRALKSTILQAQCQAVRDAQLREKEEIAMQLKEEEQRLDEMMENARIKKIAEADPKEAALKMAYIDGRKELEAQIEDRRMNRMLEEELRENESQQLLERIKEMELEDKAKAEEKAAHTREMNAEIAAANELALQLHAEKLERERQEDAELAKYIADKVAAEEEAEQKKKEEKAAADAAFAKVLKRQERAMDTQGKRDELAARRAFEEKERNLRAKEAREAKERHERALELNHARKAQIEEQHRLRALMAMAEKDDFERTLEAQKELIETQRSVEVKAKSRRIANRDEILAQVKQKEDAIRKERSEFFAEGVKIDEEARTRRARLDNIKQRKLDELVSTGLDDSYLNSVKRQINKSPVKTFS
jgi:hypothetical protein